MYSFQILAIADKLANVGAQVGFQAVGMIVVFGCLVLLALILTLSGSIATWFSNRSNAKKALAAPAKPSAPAPAAAAPATGGSIPPEVIAAISAAVYTAVGGMRHRIIDIKQSAGSAYSASGRAEIFASHRITPTRRS